MIAILRQRNFALFWFGGFVSLIGDWVLRVGLPIYVFLLTRSILATSIQLLAGNIPDVLLGSLAGVFADRWSYKRTMIVTNILLAVALLPLLLVHTADRIWIVYVVAFVEESISLFFTPAQNALLPTLIEKEHLVSANALNSLSQNAARLIGPASGGIIAGLFGLTGMILVDAASFGIAGALIACISSVTSTATSELPLSIVEAKAITNVRQEWIDGLRMIRSERTLVVLLGTFAIMGLGEGVMGTLYPIFVYRVLHGGTLQIGELMSAQAAGALIGGVLVGWAGKLITSRWILGLSAILFGLLDLAIFNTPALFPFFWLSIALFILVGVPGIAIQTGMFALMQEKAPDSYRGRIFGVLNTILGLFFLIGAITAGIITDRLGLVTVLNLQGTGYIIAGILLITLLPR
jgi:MFS family permease